jgi:hypothetical protein
MVVRSRGAVSEASVIPETDGVDGIWIVAAPSMSGQLLMPMTGEGRWGGMLLVTRRPMPMRRDSCVQLDSSISPVRVTLKSAAAFRTRSDAIAASGQIASRRTDSTG